MKKYILNFGALLIACLAFNACSSDEEVLVNIPVAKTYKVSIEASFGNAESRALDISDDYIKAYFEKGDKVFAYKKGEVGAENTVGTLTAKSTGKATTFEGSITGNFAKGDELVLAYQSYSYYQYIGQIVPSFSWQKGTKEGLGENDNAFAWVTVESVGDNIVTSTAEFENVQSIFKFNFVDKSNKSVSVKFVRFNSNAYDVALTPLMENAPHTKGDITVNLDKSSDEIWVAASIDESITSAQDIDFSVIADAEGYYYTGKKEAITGLENGKFYASTITITQTGKQETLAIKPEDSRTLNQLEYAITADAEVSGYSEHKTIRITADDLSITLNNVSIPILSNVERRPGLTITLVGENKLTGENGFGIYGCEGLTIKGDGSLTFNIPSTDTNTPKWLNENVTYDGLALINNGDGSYTIKK
ncbi:MAG: hypothetical protein E7100_05410 [Bacteroidaceae bacterium]|nr:hypothetical protein [Bacteroidaceae bacterium]